MWSYYLFFFLYFLFTKFICGELKVWNSGSPSSDLAKGKKFLKKLFYVQHLDKEKDTVSEISDRYVEEYLIADRTHFHDSNFTKFLKSPKANLSILKSSMEDSIEEVTIYSNLLTIPLQLPGVAFHAFVVFMTENFNSLNNSGYMFWSLEKNGKYIVLQQSKNKDDVINKIYDTEKEESVKRLGPITKLESDDEAFGRVRDLFRAIWGNDQKSEPYHLWTSNCQHFTSFIFEKLTGKKWSSAIVGRIGSKNKEIQPKIKVDNVKYKSIINDNKFDFYWAMMNGRREEFEQMTNNLTTETLNSVDSQGYTLLEWATVFSTSNWPIDEDLKEKGAAIRSDKGLFRRNLFFIALQFLPTKSEFLSFDGIDLNGVNKAGDTALHLALYGEKWELAEEILNRFENYDVNITNSLDDTPLHLAAKLKCEFGLFKKILNRTNSENVNKTDRHVNTALYYAIHSKSETKLEELLNHKDVDVNITNKYDDDSALHLASNYWKSDIPPDLLNFNMDVNIKNSYKRTALHLASLTKKKLHLEKQNICADQPEKKMWCLGSPSLDLLIGKNFLQKFLYVQHVDKEKDMTSEISDRYVEEYLIADRTNFHDSNFTEYLKDPKANIGMLKSLLEDEITEVTIYSYPIPIPLQLSDVTTHFFVVFQTWNYSFRNSGYMWWSLEKNPKYIVLQQSPNKDDVINKIYDTERKTSVLRFGPIKKLVTEMGWIIARVGNVLRMISDNDQISDPYNLLTSNSQHFASFIFEQLTGERWRKAIVDRIGLKKKKIHPKIKEDEVKYKSILNDNNFDCYKAMMDGRREDFKKLTNNLKIECLNGVDSQGYTLLEWATVFSTSDWPIDEELKKKGAQIPSNKRFFRRNVFFVALQYLPPNKKFLSFDGINIHGVNGTGDTALHLALYGEKWKMAVKILNRLENYDVNTTNIRGDTPLHLAAKFNCGFGLFKKILNQTNSEYVNKVDGIGNTALHYAIGKESEPAVKKLLNRKDVDVNIKNYINKTPLYLASQWEDIPPDLFNFTLLKKRTDIR